MKKTKLVALILALAMLIAMFSGCAKAPAADAPADSPAAEKPAADEPADEPAASGEKVKLKLYMLP